MERRLTNIFRFILDEIIPPFIRDNRIFMYPLFYYWFKGKHIALMMNFKNEVLTLSRHDLTNIYKHLDCRAKDRETDLNKNTVQKILSTMDPTSKNVIDVGCGNGYLLRKMDNSINKFGCDVFDSNQIGNNNSYKYYMQTLLHIHMDLLV